MTFEISVKKDKFIGDTCCFSWGIYVYLPVYMCIYTHKKDTCVAFSEVALFYVGPPAAFFPEISISGFFGHAHL